MLDFGAISDRGHPGRGTFWTSEIAEGKRLSYGLLGLHSVDGSGGSRGRVCGCVSDVGGFMTMREHLYR